MAVLSRFLWSSSLECVGGEYPNRFGDSLVNPHSGKSLVPLLTKVDSPIRQCSVFRGVRGQSSLEERRLEVGLEFERPLGTLQHSFEPNGEEQFGGSTAAAGCRHAMALGRLSAANRCSIPNFV